MCVCKGTGIITNDMGFGLYGKHPCSCAAGERSREEHKQRYNAWLKEFNEMYDAWKAGEKHGEYSGGNGEGKQSHSGTGTRSHERAAS